MIRRVHVEKLALGSIALDPAEAHHIRDVLRLSEGMSLELFDDAGAVAIGNLTHVTAANVVVMVESVRAAANSPVTLTVAAAVPKGDRADWMVEKLTELGVAKLIPLITERSVVLPAGKNKIERWERIAVEAAKQSRRSGVMKIAPLTLLNDVMRYLGSQQSSSLQFSSSEYLRTAVGEETGGWFLSTDGDALSPSQAKLTANLTLYVGPEGGWTAGEIDRMKAAGLQGVGLTSTVLRVETAAVVAAGVVLSLTATRLPSSSD